MEPCDNGSLAYREVPSSSSHCTCGLSSLSLSSLVPSFCISCNIQPSSSCAILFLYLPPCSHGRLLVSTSITFHSTWHLHLLPLCAAAMARPEPHPDNCTHNQPPNLGTQTHHGRDPSHIKMPTPARTPSPSTLSSTISSSPNDRFPP